MKRDCFLSDEENLNRKFCFRPAQFKSVLFWQTEKKLFILHQFDINRWVSELLLHAMTSVVFCAGDLETRFCCPSHLLIRPGCTSSTPFHIHSFFLCLASSKKQIELTERKPWHKTVGPLSLPVVGRGLQFVLWRNLTDRVLLYFTQSPLDKKGNRSPFNIAEYRLLVYATTSYLWT